MLDQLFRRPRVRDRIRANLLGDLDRTLRRLPRRAGPSPGRHPAVRPSRRTPRGLAPLRAHRHRGRDPGDDRFLPARSSAPLSVPHSGPDLPVSGPGGPGTPAARPRRSASHPLEPASAPNPVDVAVEHYGRYLRDTCGLAESTCTYRARYAREFLQAKFADGPMRWETIRPEDLMAFTAGYAARCRPHSAQVAASSLRSLLRFLQLRGECEPALVAAVPHIPSWRLDHLPRTMTDEQLRLFLARFDRSTPTGRRDYAMALCQVDLGLRVSEVSALRLEDVDWRAATLRIEGGKSRRTRVIAPDRRGRTSDRRVPPQGPAHDDLPAPLRPPYRAGGDGHRDRADPGQDPPRLRPSRGLCPLDGDPCPAAHRGDPPAPPRSQPQGSGRPARPSVHRHDGDLHQGRPADPGHGRAALAGGTSHERTDPDGPPRRGVSRLPAAARLPAPHRGPDAPGVRPLRRSRRAIPAR